MAGILFMDTHKTDLIDAASPIYLDINRKITLQIAWMCFIVVNSMHQLIYCFKDSSLFSFENKTPKAMQMNQTQIITNHTYL